MTDGAISQIVFKDITTIPQRDTLGLYTFDDADVDIGTGGKRDVLADESRSEVVIELEEMGSGTYG
jgi:hypothetical protein